MPHRTGGICSKGDTLQNDGQGPAGPGYRLIVQDNIQKRAVDSQPAVVLDEAQVPCS